MQEALSKIVGDANVLPGSQFAYTGEETLFADRGSVEFVVNPANAEEVAEVVSWCYSNDVTITPRGGGTGWAGGAVPQGAGIVLSLERLTAVRSFDPLRWRIEVEAGVTTATVQRLARERTPTGAARRSDRRSMRRAKRRCEGQKAGRTRAHPPKVLGVWRCRTKPHKHSQ